LRPTKTKRGVADISVKRLPREKRLPPPLPRKKRGPYRKRSADADVEEGEGSPVIPSAPATTDVGARITTLAGAMKAEIARLGSRFGRDLLRKIVEANYGSEDFLKNGSPNAFDGNLNYWASKDILEKIGTGPQAEFKVLNKEFFNHVAA
jgi:hypothetical protein